jgi:hypothetical protein
MQRLLTACISVGSLMLPIAAAQSDEFPVLNVEPVCRGIASQGAAVTIKECLEAEQQDRETMKNEWSTFSASDKKNCIAEAMMGGESSYTDLVTCLEMARDARKLK